MKLDINMHLDEHNTNDLLFLDDLDQIPNYQERIDEVALIDHNKLD